MTVAILIFVALALPLALLYLTLSINDFEKSTKSLEAVLQKRYKVEPPNKAGEAAQSMQSILKSRAPSPPPAA